MVRTDDGLHGNQSGTAIVFCELFKRAGAQTRQVSPEDKPQGTTTINIFMELTEIFLFTKHCLTG